MSCERDKIRLTMALETAREENQRLMREINLLRAQLRRHPSGELQIRQAQRTLASLYCPSPMDKRPSESC